MKIILAQYFEIFQISSSGKIYNKNIMEKQILLLILPEDEIWKISKYCAKMILTLYCLLRTKVHKLTKFRF